MAKRKKHKQSPLDIVIEFCKLQLAGNILFIGTLIGVFVADRLLYVHSMKGLIVGSICAHVVFFIVNRKWVFNTDDGGQRAWPEVMRFMIFMTFNFFLNLALVEVGRRAFTYVAPAYASYEYYAGLIIASLFFMIWSYVGLKFWVFAPAKPHARASHHHALTFEKRRHHRV